MRIGLLVALLGLSACITGRVHVGPVVDTDGNVGFRGGVSFGLGFSNEQDKAVQVTESIAGGAIGTDEDTAGTLDATLGFDYISMPRRHGIGYRAGLRFGAHGEYSDGDDDGGLLVGLNTGLLKPFKVNRSGGDCHEKGLDLFCWRGASWSSIGFEAELDLVHDTGTSDDKLLGYFGVVLEYDSIDD